MQKFYEFTQQFGVLSLDFFWFPTGIWTIVAILTFLILRSQKSLNPIYHYHLRVAAIVAIPLGFLTKYILQLLSSNSAATSTIESTFIVVKNPIDLGLNTGNTAVIFTPNLSEPNFIIGILSITVFTISCLLIIRFLKNLLSIRRLNKSLNLLPLTNFIGFSHTNYLNVRVAYLDHPMVPFTFGWKNPVIVLPKSIQDYPEKIRMAIQHELVHIKRKDYIIQLILSLIESVFWFHPIIRFESKEIEIYREISCDQEVLNTTDISLKSYAAMLFELIPLNRGFGSISVSMAVQKSNLKRRIEKMKLHKSHKSSMKRSIVFLGLMFFGVSSPIVLSDLQAQSELIYNENEIGKITNPLFKINGIEHKTYGAIHFYPQTSGFFYVLPHFGAIVVSPFPFEGAIQNGEMNGDKIQFSINEFDITINSENQINNGPQQIWVYNNQSIPIAEDGIAFGALLGDNLKSGAWKESVLQDFRSDNFDLMPITADPDNMPRLIGGFTHLMSKIVYPEKAKKNGTQGRVLVQFIVDERGNVKSPTILEGIGDGCDEAAIQAILSSAFEPGEKDGVPIKVLMSLPVVFKL